MKLKLSLYFFVGMMLFLCSSRLIQYHFQTDDEAGIEMSKSARTNPINNLLEEEMHHNTLVVLSLKLVYRLSFKNAFPTSENYPHSLYQEIIIPPPKIA